MTGQTPPLEHFVKAQAEAAEVWLAECPRCGAVLSPIVHSVEELPGVCRHLSGPPGLLLWLPEAAAIGELPPPPHTAEERAQWLAASEESKVH